MSPHQFHAKWRRVIVATPCRGMYDWASPPGQVIKRGEELSRQCVSTLCWSFATLKLRNVELFNALGTLMERSAVDARPQEIAHTAWAFAQLRIDAVRGGGVGFWEC